MKKLAIFVAIILVFAIGLINILPDYLSESNNSEPVTITVSTGDTLSSVAEDLANNGVIRSKLWFKYKGRDIAENIKPGKYDIGPGLSIEKIFDIIQEGEQEEQIKITFPEGFTLYQFAQKIEEEGLGSTEEFINATNDYFNTKDFDFDTSDLYFNMEGYLFPDTYFFTKDQSMESIVLILASTMENIFTEEYRSRAQVLGLSTHEVLTIASLIEREAYNDDERSRISGVIHNRLEVNMLLQIDATVIYGKGEGKEHMTRVLKKDLRIDNPFNTYKNVGLTPGPIASPGKKSIYAALYPEDHDYFYYVLGENGHVFSKTYDEHRQNVNKYIK